MSDLFQGLVIAAGSGGLWAAWDHRERLARAIAIRLVIWADAVAFRQAALKRLKEKDDPPQ